MERLGLGDHLGEACLVHARTHLGEACHLGTGAGALLGGDHLHAAGVRVSAHRAVEQALEVAVGKPGAHVGHGVLVAQVARGRAVVVEPAAHGLDGEAHAVRVAPVALAQVELGLGKRRLEVVLPQALGHERGARGLHEVAEVLGHARLGALELEDEHRLEQAVVEEAGDVAAQAALEHHALEWRLVGAHEGVDEDVGRQHALALRGRGEHVGHAHAGVVGRRGHGHLQKLGRDGLVQGQRVGFAGAALGRAQEALVEKRQLFLDVEVAVERGVGVLELVVARVRVEELLVGELGDVVGVAARDPAVRRIGEERAHDAVQQELLWVGEGAPHLVVDHAVVGERGLGGVLPTLARALGLAQLVVPALLLEDARAVVDGRVQHRVQVHVHEVLEVLVVGGGHRVHGLVREGEGVQERLHRALEQVHEGLLDREAVGAAEHRVLEDVEDARVVGGRRLEGDGEGLVVVGAGKPHEAGARGRVAHHVGAAAHLRQGLGDLDDEAVVGATRRQVWLWGGKVMTHGDTFREAASWHAPLRAGAVRFDMRL